MPLSVQVICQSAFCKCQSLRSARLNEGLEILGTNEYPEEGRAWCGVFEGSALERVELPSTLKRIEYSAFDGCKKLKSINLPERLGYIGRCCFRETALDSVTLPPALRTIEDNTFYLCESLRTVIFSEGLEKIDSCAFAKSGISQAEFPDSLRSIS